MRQQRQISADDLVNSIGATGRVLGVSDRHVSSVARIDEASSESAAFCNKKGAEGLQMVRDSRAGIIICHDGLQVTGDELCNKTLILVSNPRLAFIRVMQRYFQGRPEFGIHPTALIHEDAKIHPNVYIGPNTCIMDKCEIGENTIVYGSVYIYPNTRIGRNVIIHAGTVIGATGFGYERNDEGELERFPHIGGVVIEDNVEIGSNVCIDRGTLDNTVIGQGTKISNFCQVAHNVNIGKHCAITSKCMIGGSTKIGDYCWIAPCACIINGIEIGPNVVIGMGSVVLESVPADTQVMGNPARVIKKLKLDEEVPMDNTQKLASYPVEDAVAERIRAIAAEVLNTEGLPSLDSTPNDLESWDSIGNLNLILAVEEAFQVTLNDEHISEINSLRDMCQCVMEALRDGEK